MRIKKLPPIEVLNEALSYNPETGELRWRTNRGRCRAGDLAGSKTKLGYYLVRVCKELYFAHRIAWAMYYGEDPYPHLVDHKHGVEEGNGIKNLRLADHKINGSNRALDKRSTSGFRGVSYNTRDKRWNATLNANGTYFYLGYFECKEDAINARLKAEQEHGIFVREM